MTSGMRAVPACKACWFASINATRKPAWAKQRAMPLPMVPAPMTPTSSTRRESARTPPAARSAKNKYRRAREPGGTRHAATSARAYARAPATRRAPGTGNQPQVHLWKSKLQVRRGATVMTGKSRFGPASQRRAVQRGHHRLTAGLDTIQHVEQQRCASRMLEFTHVGAGDEIPAGSMQHDGRDRSIQVEGFDRDQERLTDGMR